MRQPPSRHRGKHHDPVGAALNTVWALGHAVVIALMGGIVHNQLDPGHLGTERATHSTPDHEPLV